MSTIAPPTTLNELVRELIPAAILKIDQALIEGTIKLADVAKEAGVDIEQVEEFVEQIKLAGFTYRHSKEGFLLVRSRVDDFCERYGLGKP